MFHLLHNGSTHRGLRTAYFYHNFANDDSHTILYSRMHISSASKIFDYRRRSGQWMDRCKRHCLHLLQEDEYWPSELLEADDMNE